MNIYLVLVFAHISVVLATLHIYPAPGGVPASDKFRVYVQQENQPKQESFTYISKSDHRHRYCSKVRKGRSVSWTSFSFTGNNVTVEIYTTDDFDSCIVRPNRYGFHCRRTGIKTAHVVVDSNSKQMSIEFDNDYGSYNREIKNKLLVFVDPPLMNEPNPNDDGVLYYGQGVHDLKGQKELEGSITEVYVAPGAFIKGGFITTADHPVKIHGRGVISTANYQWRSCKFEWAVINMDSGSGHMIEGVTISDPIRFYIRANGTNNTVRNLKTVAAWTHNSDGVVTGSNGLVENSFFMANDDAIKLYAGNIVIRDCVVWQCQNGAVFQMGWLKKIKIHHVRVSDVDVIHTDWCTHKGRNCRLSENNAVLDHRSKTMILNISDIEFKDIRVEGICPRIIQFELRREATGSVSDIRLINWNIESQITNDSLHNAIAGSDHVQINNWQFTNFKISNECVNNPVNYDFVINRRSTRNAQFNC